MTRDTKTNQVHGNQTREKADGPGFNRPAQGAGGQPPYELLEYIKKYMNKDITLKELADLGLAIEYILEWAVDHGYGADDRLSEIGSEIETEVV